MKPSPLASLRIIWASFCMAQVIFVAVAFLVGPMGSDLPPWVLPPAAALAAAAVFPLRAQLMGTAALAGPGADRSEPSAAAWGRYQTGTIVGLALAEAVGIFGLTHALLAGPTWAVLGYAAVALGLAAVQMPTLEGAQAVERATRR